MYQIEDYTLNGYRPGMIGRLAHLQAHYYGYRFGLDMQFEANLVTELSDFLTHFKPGRDGLWLLTRGDELFGSVAVDGRQAESGALIRWVFLAAEARGQGLAKSMFYSALEFCQEVGYRRIRLYTNADLTAAVLMYRKAGFKLICDHTEVMGGKPIVLQQYEYLVPQVKSRAA